MFSKVGIVIGSIYVLLLYPVIHANVMQNNAEFPINFSVCRYPVVRCTVLDERPLECIDLLTG